MQEFKRVLEKKKKKDMWHISKLTFFYCPEMWFQWEEEGFPFLEMQWNEHA